MAVLRIVSLLIGFLSAWLANASAETVRINGTGSAILSVKRVLEPYMTAHSQDSYETTLPPMGSGGAIKALLEGHLDIALSGRPLKKEEQAANLQQFWLGQSPFVVVVPKQVALQNITLAQVADIYAGRQKRWPDGSRIRVILRPIADADTALLNSISPAMAEALKLAHANRQPGAALADTDIDLVSMIDKVPDSFGTVSLSMVLAEPRAIKALSLDEVEPTLANLENHRYPLSKPLYLIMRHDASPTLRALVAYLQSDEGKQRMVGQGFTSQQPRRLSP
ncbi:MAG: substrate-binding domain-containing protein [Magnetococcales bacterium]|nr:substrate-binding domain-containing protein [Magnetococcales bacterium]